MTHLPDQVPDPAPQHPTELAPDESAPATRAERRAAAAVPGEPVALASESAPAPVAPPALDADTYTQIREPRSAAKLALAEGTWHQISKKYVWVQVISTGAFMVIVAAVMLVLALALGQTWAYIPGGIVLLISLVGLAIVPRQARAYGYQLRRDDLVFRRGILWQRFVAVPYGRMQLIDITHGPLDRGFGIAQLKLVTAAAATGVVIPGLTQASADDLRDVLIDVAEARRTGL